MGIIEIIEIIYTGIMEIIEIMYRLRDWAWPIIFLIFIIMFNKPIFEFLQRLKTLEIFGTVLKTRIPAEQKITEIKKSLPKSEKEIIRRDAKKRNNAKLRLALKEYTLLLNKYTHEKNFNSIYGTQLDLLEHLSRRETLGEKYINLWLDFYMEFCRRWKLKYSVPSPSMIKYLEFLEARKYIEREIDGEELIVKITQEGKDFLSYIKDQYPAELRPFRHL